MTLLVYAVLLHKYNCAYKLLATLQPLALSVLERQQLFRELSPNDRQVGRYSRDIDFIHGCLKQLVAHTDSDYNLPESLFICQDLEDCLLSDDTAYNVQKLLHNMQANVLLDSEEAILGGYLIQHNLIQFFSGTDIERLKFIDECPCLETLNILQLGLFSKIQADTLSTAKYLLQDYIIQQHLIRDTSDN